MMIRSIEISYMKEIQAIAVRSFSRAPGSFKLPRLRSRSTQKSLHHLQPPPRSVTRSPLRRRTIRSSWSKRLATLVEANYKLNLGVSASDDDTNTTDENWVSREVHTLPNLITCTRIASAPLLGYFIATEQTNYALMGCGMAAASDWLDGYIARKYNLATRLGSYLDPLGKYRWRVVDP